MALLPENSHIVGTQPHLHRPKVLVIDDDAHTRELVEILFVHAGFHVSTAPDGRDGLRQVNRFQPNLLILDIMMPGLDGLEVCRRIRHLHRFPIIFLTVMDREEDVVRGMDAGGDDYLIKPFSPKVLLARARAAIRRAELAQKEDQAKVYDDGYLKIDLVRYLVMVEGEPVKLTPKEYQLLRYLYRNANWVVTYQELLFHIWGEAYQDSPDYVHVHISHLRRKLEKDTKNPQYLLTEHGVGYRFKARYPH